MAPIEVDGLSAQIKDVIHNLYSLIIQSYEYRGTTSANAMSVEIKNLVQNLAALSRSADGLPIEIPPEVIEYVENGRNPDIYTREFVEIVQKDNQQLKGMSDTFTQFQSILADDIIKAVPELKDGVEAVLKATEG